MFLSDQHPSKSCRYKKLPKGALSGVGGEGALERVRWTIKEGAVNKN